MAKPVEFTICNCGNPEGHTGPVWHPGQPIPEGVRLTEAQLLGMMMQPPKEAEIALAVTRCGCGDPDSHNGKNGPARPCPKPRSTTDLGRQSYFHSNPFKRLHWHFIGRRKAANRVREEARQNL